MNPYQKLQNRKRKWTPVQTTAGQVKEGVEEVIFRALAMRHMEFLGNTLEKITAEKCGILKQQTQIIISKQSSSVLKQIDKETENNNSPRFIFGEDFQVSKENGRFIYQDDQSLFDLDLPNLQGDHQLLVHIAYRQSELSYLRLHLVRSNNKLLVHKVNAELIFL